MIVYILHSRYNLAITIEVMQCLHFLKYFSADYFFVPLLAHATACQRKMTTALFLLQTIPILLTKKLHQCLE
jgi:hypothetical protein